MVHKKRKAKLPKEVRDFISRQIKIEIESGRPQSQAIAMSYSMARREFPEHEDLLKR